MSSEEVRDKVKEYIRKACAPLDRVRYRQESAYVDALIGRLDGEIEVGSKKGSIKLTPTVVADRGADSAESKYGADFAIVLQSRGVANPVNKAVIAQAKNGSVDKLNGSEASRLSDQCKKMARITKDYMVLEAPLAAGAIPTVRIGRHDTAGWHEESISFDDYFLDQLLSCKHGDRREGFIEGVSSSNLSGIKVDVDGVEYIPEKKPRKKNKTKPKRGDLEPDI